MVYIEPVGYSGREKPSSCAAASTGSPDLALDGCSWEGCLRPRRRPPWEAVLSGVAPTSCSCGRRRRLCPSLPCPCYGRRRRARAPCPDPCSCGGRRRGLRPSGHHTCSCGGRRRGLRPSGPAPAAGGGGCARQALFSASSAAGGRAPFLLNSRHFSTTGPQTVADFRKIEFDQTRMAHQLHVQGDLQKRKQIEQDIMDEILSKKMVDAKAREAAAEAREWAAEGEKVLAEKLKQEALNMKEEAERLQKERAARLRKEDAERAARLRKEDAERLKKAEEAAEKASREKDEAAREKADAEQATEKAEEAKKMAEEAIEMAARQKAEAEEATEKAEEAKKKAEEAQKKAEEAKKSEASFGARVWQWVKDLDWTIHVLIVVYAFVQFGFAMNMESLKSLALAWTNYYFKVPIGIVNEALKMMYPDAYPEDVVKMEVVLVIDGVTVRISESEVKKSDVELFKASQVAALRPKPVEDGPGTSA